MFCWVRPVVTIVREFINPVGGGAVTLELAALVDLGYRLQDDRQTMTKGM